MRADPGVITRIIIPFEGFTGRYVWHCHILEHEDNEMMRPYEVASRTRAHINESTVPRLLDPTHRIFRQAAYLNFVIPSAAEGPAVSLGLQQP